jgi:hypothetical protein
MTLSFVETDHRSCYLPAELFPSRLSHFPDGPKAHTRGRRENHMTPRFKAKPTFDFSLPCPSCGYKIQPHELVRWRRTRSSVRAAALSSALAGRKPLSTS